MLSPAFLARLQTAVVPLALAAVLSACSFTDDALEPSLTGQAPSGGTGTQSAAAGTSGGQPAVQGAGGPALGQSQFQPPEVTPGQPTGTAVGQKVQELRGDLQRLTGEISEENNRLQALRAAARDNAANYHQIVAAINARLQVGTTPGNPQLVQLWNQAQGRLTGVGNSLTELNGLSNDAASSAALASFMLDAINATYGIYGAVEEDHRQLAILEDEVNKSLVVLDRLLGELTADVQRTQNYYAREQQNLTTLAVAIDNGEYIGGSLANISSTRVASAARPSTTGAIQTAATVSEVGRKSPLVVIRFGGREVKYEPALYAAVSAALERRPSANFDVVGVAPPTGSPAEVALATNQARREADQVARSLANMGLPRERVALGATSNRVAQVSEVHVYVR